MRALLAVILISSAGLVSPASAQAGACASLVWHDEPLPNGRLVPETGLFRSNVSYVVSNTGRSCEPTTCASPEDRVRFEVTSRPPYATSTFTPASSPLRAMNGTLTATTVFTVNTTREAPALQDGTYRVKAASCPSPTIEETKVIKNDYLPGTAVEAGNSTGAPGSADGIAGPGWIVVSGALAIGAILSPRRRD